MKAIVIMVALCVICGVVHAQSFPTLSFKGLQLGMTNDQIDSLVRTSRWGYIYSTDQNAPDTAILLMMGVDGHKSDDERLRDTFANIGCKGSDCASFGLVLAFLRDGHLSQIFINEQSYSIDDASDLVFSARMTLEAITRKYGKPTTLDAKLDKVTRRDLLRIGDDFKPYVARWIWKDGKGDKVYDRYTIDIYITKGSDGTYRVVTQINEHLPETVKTDF